MGVGGCEALATAAAPQAIAAPQAKIDSLRLEGHRIDNLQSERFTFNRKLCLGRGDRSSAIAVYISGL